MSDSNFNEPELEINDIELNNQITLPDKYQGFTLDQKKELLKQLNAKY